MEFVPIIEIVQIDRIARSGSIIRNAVGAENTLASVVVMNISPDSAIELVDASFIELCTRLFFDPGLELRIARTLTLDKACHCVGLQTEGVQHHGVVAFADSGIARAEAPALFQG